MIEPSPRPESAFADRYRVERPLGEGGMATVYLAHDLRHDRQVALKVLKAEVSAALGAERFQREITTTAKLRHPHILPLYDSGVLPDTALGAATGTTLLCYVMPFVDGETLRDRLQRDRQLPIAEALRIAGEVADALAYAHEQGIVHRDIKPENILLERGRAIVADFGIARAVDMTTDAKLTQTGMAIGSPAYMSPEQSVGDAVDRRTDLYALGCVLFEMLAGEPPYIGSSAQAIIAKRFRDPAPRVSTLRDTVSPAVEAALLTVLAKSPSDRFATAADFIAALRSTPETTPGVAQATAPGTAPGVSAMPPAQRADADEFRIAVLPFTSAASSAELTTLADGLTGDIIAGLLRFPWLRVVARTPGAAARAADARYQLEGNVRQAGTRVRLAVQLVDVASGVALWAEQYDRSFAPDAIFELQDDLVPRIVSTCGDHFGVLARSISDAVRSHEASQLTPYEALMRGFGYHLRLTPEEHAVARDALERAVSQVPGNADCLAMLSWITAHEVAHGFNPRPDSLDRAFTLARRAVELAPSNHLAHQALAVALFFRRETTACLAAAERAIALNPLDGSNEAFFLLCFTGRWDRGCALIREAIDRNPHHPRWYETILAINSYRLGDFRAAADQAMRLNAPEIFWNNILLAAAGGQLGDQRLGSQGLATLLGQKPDFASTGESMLRRWFEPALLAAIMDGLRKAGLSPRE